MSVQFGRWNFDGKQVEPKYLEKVKPLLTRYGPDNLGLYLNGNLGILYCAFHTTKESRREIQPHVTASDAVITWDGRLDNRDHLIHQLTDVVTTESTDVGIVAAAYMRWGSDCFSRLMGDWAMSIWEPRTRSLILAKDLIGVRHLYYSLEDDQATWSSILDPLILLAGRRFALSEEYIAGWFSHLPATHLTPYVGIQSVPPACSVEIKNGKSIVRKYTNFNPDKRIRYRSDAEYEEHFRTVFAEAVRRRLRSNSPILAELSGGMDSSSIVCMADTIIARHKAETPRLDTVSYYDDSEPNWNERPYFTKVEEKRGRPGFHIDFTNQERFDFELDSDRFAAIPGSGGRPTKQVRQFAACLASQGNRVVLSGIGGDEVMGGVPTPVLELADLLARAHFGILAHQLRAWALNMRMPWLRLLFTTARRFLPVNPCGVRKGEGPPAWLDPNFVERNRTTVQGFQTRLNLFGPLPSFQGNIFALTSLQKQLGCELLQAEPLFEKRYPYLDHELLEFIYAIPREQLARPGQRRSLMRRALQQFVPKEILERKRKAYVSKSPILALQMARKQIETLLAQPLSVQYGCIDSTNLASFIDRITSGKETKEWSLLRKTAMLEIWLRANSDYLMPAEFAGFQHEFMPAFRADKIRAGRVAT